MDDLNALRAEAETYLAWASPAGVAAEREDRGDVFYDVSVAFEENVLEYIVLTDVEDVNRHHEFLLAFGGPTVRLTVDRFGFAWFEHSWAPGRLRVDDALGTRAAVESILGVVDYD